MPRYRVLSDKEDRQNFPADIKIEINYPSFCIVSGPEPAIEQLRSRHLVEPIETRERIYRTLNEIGGAMFDTLEVEATKGRTRLIRVTFAAPIKKAWLTAMEKLGAQVLDTEGNSTVVLKVTSNKAVDAVKRHKHVARIENYRPNIQVSAAFLESLGAPLFEATQEAVDELRNSFAVNKPASAPEVASIIPGCVQAVFLNKQFAKEANEQLSNVGIDTVLPPKCNHLFATLGEVQGRETQLQHIAGSLGLKSLEHVPLYQLSNNLARDVLAGPGMNLDSFGLTGEGEIVGVADSGLDTGNRNSLHSDIMGRVINIRSFPIDAEKKSLVLNPGADDGPQDDNTGHGTHVVGSILGDGSRANGLGLNTNIRGVAPKAKLVFQAIEQKTDLLPVTISQFFRLGLSTPIYTLFGIPANLRDLFQPAYDLGARIHNNSWGGGDPGTYNKACLELDQFVWNNKDFLVVVAAGNEGSAATSTDGKTALGSIAVPGTAKNCLTVGASENSRLSEFSLSYGSNWTNRFRDPPLNSDPIADNIDDIAAFSSRGPCLTQRRKPDVIAPGTFILSMRSSQITSFGWARFGPAPNDYMYISGTSMSAPLVSGCAALVREYLRKKRNISNPAAALLKAALIHSAKYIPYRFGHSSSKRFADNEQGWGRVQLASILAPPPPIEVLFINGDNLKSGGKQEFSIDVSTAGQPFRVTMVYTDFPGDILINNLNLLVKAPDGSTFRGNDFQGSGNLDKLNNVEGVLVSQAIAGRWVITVFGSEIVQSPQDFALVISGAGAKRVN